MKTANLFKPEDFNINYNACVGDNGFVSINTYIEGYQSAVLVMLESVLATFETNEHIPENVSFWNVDTAIYPILFSARHFVELYLKQKIHAINYLKIKDNIENKITKTHDIKKLWELFKKIVNDTFDDRIDYFIPFIEPYVNDFSKIDLTGETFRYPYNEDYSQKHLTNYSVIGLYNFYEKFNELSEVFLNFTNVMDILIDEYRVRTYTKHLSRKDIEIIAKKLPVRSQWNDLSFDCIKNSIKNEYKIGSKELSDVIKIIDNHIEFKTYIYPNIYELEIDKEKLISIIKKDISFQDMEIFNLEEVASLRTLIELGTSIIDGKYYSEDYNILYKKYLNEMKIDELDYEVESNYQYSIKNSQRIKLGLEKLGYSKVWEGAKVDD
ncbi:Uncharacterised protein [Moraxella caprae]|uniref:Uncharacterized protein n=1 Tax=Moraxella caprae TaxID=90240 RepID=A0A378R4F1_9GAMM|nr:hypothetical protein [Moraxella caprae]STZ09659.1 Uncharacterised protein [Moraxella caprae]